ncbi:hypothetical protein EYX47_15265 [Escherichia coli]|jgi:hypothetical protein|nr:hypothetical protein [Escherichia coli]ELD23919.1 hypothetical protein A15U_01464 [Escherichia coli KTE210]EQX81205.1 hypothetical protein G938_04844 [Escherichia coli UMEA 3200-1]EEW1892736.1 hypothetical protein [Escherichia coli]EEW2531415.1 hypothetical protein [Escherichia coli]
MSEQFNPLRRPASAAQQVVLEVVRAGKLYEKTQLSELFTHMLDHYRAEAKRLEQENKAQ